LGSLVYNYFFTPAVYFEAGQVVDNLFVCGW